MTTPLDSESGVDRPPVGPDHTLVVQFLGPKGLLDEGQETVRIVDGEVGGHGGESGRQVRPGLAFGHE